MCVCIYVRQELACEPKQAANIDAFLGDLDVFQVWAAGVGAGGLIWGLFKSPFIFFQAFRRTFAKLSHVGFYHCRRKWFFVGARGFQGFMQLPWHVLCPLITDTLIAEEQEAKQFSCWCVFGWAQPSMNKRRLSQASLLRLPICLFPGREKAKWFRLRICFFRGREKAKWFRLRICLWFRLAICFFPGREKANLLFPGPGKSKMVQTSNLLFSKPGKNKMVQTSILLFSRAGKKQNGSDFQWFRLPIREKAKCKCIRLAVWNPAWKQAAPVGLEPTSFCL